MLKKQKQTPLFEALCRHAAKNPAGFHMPGHGRGQGLPEEFSFFDGKNIFSLDLTELPGLDDLNNPHGVIAEAQELAAGLYGADRSFFLVNGTSVGIQALITAVAGPGEIIVPRNAHRSVIGGVIISGADPVYVVPDTIPYFGIDCGVAPRVISQALKRHPGAAAVLAVRPSYYGVARDLKELVEVVHSLDRPLMVDEAHGGHLRFHPLLPADAMESGADASVQSTHKLGGSLTQSSLLHLHGRLIDHDRVAAALRLLQTTSPSYVLMLSLDLARRQMALFGENIMDKALELARGTRKLLSEIKGLKVLTEGDLPESSLQIDQTKLVVSVLGLGFTGYQVSRLLAENYNIYVEMADSANITALISLGTTGENCTLLVSALKDIAARNGQRRPAGFPEAPAVFKKRMKPRDAWFSPARRVALADAGGRISAETVAVYPPGIPVVNPGEEITPEILAYLKLICRIGLTCQGPSDPALKTIKVVIE